MLGQAAMRLASGATDWPPHRDAMVYGLPFKAGFTNHWGPAVATPGSASVLSSAQVKWPGYGVSASFNATADARVTVTGIPAFAAQCAWAVWIYTAGTSGVALFHRVSSGNGGMVSIGCINDRGRLRVFLPGAGNSSVVMPSHAWHYVVVNVDGSAASVYMDGALQFTQTGVNLEGRTPTSSIIGGDDLGFYWNGFLVDAAYYSGVNIDPNPPAKALLW